MNYMASPRPAETAPEEPPQPLVFGMRLSTLSVAEAVEKLAGQKAAAGSEGGRPARLFVTPNIQHIAEMRASEGLRSAMQAADLATCDGFPVLRYARLRGCSIAGRVTGREVVAELMRRDDLLRGHRLFFLVESEETAAAVRRWADARRSLFETGIEVAPQGFGSDLAYCDALARRMAHFGSSLVFLCLGAPRSEIFAREYRAMLPDCWLLCIGQSVRVALGVAPEPPGWVVGLHAEWFWRLCHEPRRLLRRYAHGAIGFTLAALGEMFAPDRSGQSPGKAADNQHGR